jgi:hypothetical protein
VIGANRAEFIFENINLPFTEPDKHGYVAFKIKTKPNLVLGNTVTNQADIFFDYNFPITTNLTSTTIANSPVVATVSSLNNLNCTNATTVLTASGGWLYDFGSGFSQTATLTVNASGTYTVTVQDINGYTGTSTIVLAQDITPPTSSITNANELNCATPTSVITASGGVEYNFGNGFAAVNTMEVSESGTYTVIVKGANGCTASTEIAVTADLTPPIGSITNANELNCTTPTSVITASGGVEYNFGNGFAVVNTMEVSQIGTYIVTVKGANGCTASTEIAVTADLTPPTVLINASLSFPCTTITATGGGTYLWNTGETTASFTANQGDYTVTITGTNGCTATETQAITETVVSISQTGNTLIAPSGGNTYQWFWNEQPIEAATMAIYIPTESGNYRVEIGNEQGCIVSSSVLAYLYVSTASENNSAGIEIYPNPTNGMLTLQTKTPFNANQTITVSNLMGQTVHISNVLSQTTTNNIDISFLTAGVYFVAVRDSKTGDTKVVKILLQK